jgi:hypothetical protein
VASLPFEITDTAFGPLLLVQLGCRVGVVLVDIREFFADLSELVASFGELDLQLVIMGGHRNSLIVSS